MSGQGRRPDFLPADPRPDEPKDHRPPGYQSLQPTPAAPAGDVGAARRPAWVPICISLAVVLVLLLAVDRLAPRIIGNQIGATLQAVLGTRERPEVVIGGFPFLTQVLTSRYTMITMTAHDVPIASPQSRKLAFSTVRGRLIDVDAGDRYRTITIKRFEGSATVGYRSLSDFVGVPISYDDGSPGAARIRIRLPASITVTGVPVFDPAGQNLTLADPRLEIAGRQIPAEGARAILQRLDLTLPELLPGVVITAVRAGPDGLTLSGAGTNLTLER